MTYGKNGILGVLTPQANTTVEPEFWALLPPGWSMLNARLTSSLETIEKRLVDYTTRFETTASQFANAPVSAVTVACTGASYLIGREEEIRITANMQKQRGVPCLTSGQASAAALQELGARKIALLTPYPELLNRASVPYWESHGFEVVASTGPGLQEDAFHPIYTMAEQGVCEAYGQLSQSDADVVLMLGTGMATLGAILYGREKGLLPAVSCNLATVWYAIAQVSLKEGDHGAQPLSDWLSGAHWQKKFELLA